MQTVTSIQEGLIAEFHRIDAQGIGDHRKRSKRTACKRARKSLASIGIDSEDMRDYQIRQAIDVYELQAAAN